MCLRGELVELGDQVHGCLMVSLDLMLMLTRMVRFRGR